MMQILSKITPQSCLLKEVQFHKDESVRLYAKASMIGLLLLEFC